MAYPVTLLSSWILTTILENVERRDVYVSDVASKRFIAYHGPRNCNIKYTPLVRIFVFFPVTTKGELVAIVNDFTHKITVVFTREAIRRFETRYGQRLTYKSVHRLIIIRQANLKFMDKNTYMDFHHVLGNIPPGSLKGTPLIYLEVNEAEYFLRDAHTVPASAESTLRFVYTAPEFQMMFGTGYERHGTNTLLNTTDMGISTEECEPCIGDYDGMVSEAEEEEYSRIVFLDQVHHLASPTSTTGTNISLLPF